MAESKKELYKEFENKDDFLGWIDNINWSLDKNSDINSKEKQEKIVNCIGDFFVKNTQFGKNEYIEILDRIYGKANGESRYLVLLVLFWVNAKKGLYSFSKYVSNKCIEIFGDIVDFNVLNSIELKAKEDSSIIDDLIIKIDTVLKKVDKDLTYQNSALICYIFIASNSYNYMYKNDFTLLLERRIIDYFTSNYGDKKDIKLMNFFPNSILGNRVKNDSFIASLKGYNYLYDGLDEKNELLEQQRNTLLSQKDSLNERINQQNQIVLNLNAELIEKEQNIKKLNAIISDLQDNNSVLEIKLENEKNNMMDGYEDMKHALISSLKKDLSYEFEGIEDIIEYVQEDKRARIQKRIDRIKNILEEKLGA